MRRVWLALGAALASVSWAAHASVPVLLRSQHPARDAVFEDRELPADSELVPWMMARAVEMQRREAYLDDGEALVPVAFAELGISLDTTRMLASARAVEMPRTALERLKRIWSGPPLHPRELAPAFHFHRERARDALTRLAPQLARAPIQARLDLDAHRRIEDEPGRELMIEDSLAAIERGERGEGAQFPLAFRMIPAQVKSSELPPVDVSHVLSSYETDFKGKAGPRAVNIRRAARLLDRVVIAPGARFSFNRAVGRRVAARGFVDAPVIVNDEKEAGVGGGVCQVATTLHAAAVFAGVQIDERRSHSRASGYAPLGLDATVIDGKVDLRLTNPYDVPVMIHAFLPTRTTVRVEILGKEPVGSVEHSPHLVGRQTFRRRIVERDELSMGRYEVKQSGAYGYDIVSLVRYTRADGNVTTRRYKSKYYPVPEVLWVGRGTSEAELPPLPDGAEGIEPPVNAPAASADGPLTRSQSP